ncbi:MAG: hypothetical protein AAF502_19230 [Bacteroidota bacterium]
MKYSIFLLFGLFVFSCGQGPENQSKDFPSNLKIAFTSYRDGNGDIFFVNPNGTGIEKITASAEDNSFAKWANEGRTLEFTRSKNRSNFTKYSKDLSSGKETPITYEPITEGDLDRSYSPDGSMIAFRKRVNKVLELYVAKIDGTGIKKVTSNGPSRDTALLENTAWSNDGSKLAYLSGKDPHNLFLRVYDVKKRRSTKITDRGYLNSGMKWSKDDKKIFLSARLQGKKSTYEIHAVDLATKEMTPLTSNPGTGNLYFDVSPDGNWIVFESLRDSDARYEKWNSEIYIMRTDGSEQMRVTNHTAFDGRPVWFPLTK